MSLIICKTRGLFPFIKRNAGQLRYNIIDKKNFSGAVPPNSEDEAPMKKQLLWGTGIAGGVVTLYGISTMLYTVTSSLMTLTPMSSLYYGFVGGCITAAAGSSAFMSSGRLTSVHPEVAWGAALKLIDADKSVATVLGKRTCSSSGTVKAFRHTGGGLTVRGGRPTWALPHIEMLVKVSGEKSDALAVVRVSREQLMGAASVQYLCMYFDDSQNSVSDVLLAGDRKDDALKEGLERSLRL